MCSTPYFITYYIMVNLHNISGRIRTSVIMVTLFWRNVNSLYCRTDNECYWLNDDYNLFLIVSTRVLFTMKYILIGSYYMVRFVHTFKKVFLIFLLPIQNYLNTWLYNFCVIWIKTLSSHVNVNRPGTDNKFVSFLVI